MNALYLIPAILFAAIWGATGALWVVYSHTQIWHYNLSLSRVATALIEGAVVGPTHWVIHRIENGRWVRGRIIVPGKRGDYRPDAGNRFLSVMQDGYIVDQIPTGLTDDQSIDIDNMLRQNGLLDENEEVAVTETLPEEYPNAVPDFSEAAPA